ncbi:MAG: hypothetical protein D6731_17790, partial [Planctomycetota bacterium]
MHEREGPRPRGAEPEDHELVASLLQGRLEAPGPLPEGRRYPLAGEEVLAEFPWPEGDRRRGGRGRLRAAAREEGKRAAKPARSPARCGPPATSPRPPLWP